MIAGRLPVSTARAATTDAIDEQESYSVRLASKYASPTSSAPPEERRQFTRRRSQDLDWIRTARLKSGGPVSLIDLSAGGALIDADIPLRPGSILSLEIVGRGMDPFVVTLHVLRCHVTALMADSARYRGACVFARPIELPGFHPLPDLPAASDTFAGIDFALKRLVEQAYAPDIAQRLAAGDVMLVLQALARRTLSAGSDAFGRQVGCLLEELLPSLKHGETLPAVLAAIERQLCEAMPNSRVRLIDTGEPAQPGSKSVLINLPGGAHSIRSVSIDLPPGAVVNDSQARLLRTSSRLIALAQRLNAYVIGGTTGDATAPAGVPTAGSESRRTTPFANPQAAPSTPFEPDGGTGSANWQKIVVRYTDGHILKGFSQDFHGSKPQFSLWPSINAAPAERIVVPLARLKAVFFVREFGGNRDHIEQKTFENAAHGRRIEVTLLDDEVLVGTTLNYRSDTTGFFLNPVDPLANNQRVFVVASAVRQVRFP